METTDQFLQTVKEKWQEFKETSLYANLKQNGGDEGIIWAAFYEGMKYGQIRTD